MSDILGYVSKTGHGTYYRETITPELAELEQGGRKMWTPLVSATDSAALRAELAKHQESEFHPDWSMLEATRDSLAEHQQIIRDQRERIKLLEGALRRYVNYDLLTGTRGKMNEIARAALEKT